MKDESSNSEVMVNRVNQEFTSFFPGLQLFERGKCSGWRVFPRDRVLARRV